MKTHPGIVEKVLKTLGNGGVIHHDPTPENRLGQSGLHTFIDDIQDVVDEWMTGPDSAHPAALQSRSLLQLRWQ